MDLNIMTMDENSILEEVDEYLLFCLYLGFQPELRVRYKSQIRTKGNEDTTASWSMFYNNNPKVQREFTWKDSGTGQFGDIYKFVQLKYGYRFQEQAIDRVRRDVMISPHAQDLLLNAGTIEVKSATPAAITVKSREWADRDLEWWGARTSANRDVLARFNTTRAKYYWMTKEQKTPSFPGDPCYATRIYDHYNLYFPERNKDRKFRNDYNDNHLPGFCQLQQQSDTLIIQKSNKDIIAGFMMGFECVAPRGEHTLIPSQFMQFLKKTYKYIFTLFDNDGKHKAWAYDVPSIEFPPHMPKDTSDNHLAFGQKPTKELIRSLIKNHPSMEINIAHLDLTKKRTRLELEEIMEKVYLNRVIIIQHVTRKVTRLCGKIHRIAVDFDKQGEPLCIIMLDNDRYEFGLGYFIQKALIQQHDGNTYTTDQSD